MKIGIITMISDNYGNRLQNYALQEVLNDLGNSVETLHNPWGQKRFVFLETLEFNIKKIIFYFFKKPKRFKRRINFENFNRENISFSKFWLNKNQDKEKANHYFDLFICGSDQIWNSEAKEIDGKFFADFADPAKRASYAASFGIDTIVEDRKAEYKEYLLGMKYISVREQSAVKIVEELIDKKPDWHLDPTLLLSSIEWDVLVNKHELNKGKYIFCYFLGKPNENILQELVEYNNKYKLRVITIANIEDNSYNHVGPSEFVALIKHAEFILTDSFHGTVFSIIYHKPFYTFSRNGVKNNMDTRVISLLTLLKIPDRFNPKYLDLEKVHNIDFHNADIILDKERKKAIDYLSLISK